jgi:hypothetical protein
MGPLAQFLLALTNLVRSGIIRKLPDAIKAAEREFGRVTPLLRKQIERIFEQAKKPVIGKPGKKEGTVLPFVRDVKKTEGIESIESRMDTINETNKKLKEALDEYSKIFQPKTEDAKPLDKFNLSEDDPMGDLEKIVKGEGDTGLPSQFTDKDVEAAIDNASPGFASGDNKYNAELVAEELAESKGIDYDGLPVKERSKIYGRALDGLQKFRMKQEITKTDDLMDFFQKEIEKAEKPSGKFEGLESTDNIRMGIEDLKNPARPGGPLDPVTGVTRTIARRILDKKGIKIDRREDPLDIFLNNFGVGAGTDIQNLADEVVEAEQSGRNLKPLDDLIEIEGFFDLEVQKNPDMGMTTDDLVEQLEKDLKEKETLEDFDTTDREPNATGGLTRTSYAMGRGPVLPSDEDPINPFGPKPTGPVLPDKSMMADPGDKFISPEYQEQFRKFLMMLEESEKEQSLDRIMEMFKKYMLSKEPRVMEAATGGLAKIINL